MVGKRECIGAQAAQPAISDSDEDMDDSSPSSSHFCSALTDFLSLRLLFSNDFNVLERDLIDLLLDVDLSSSSPLDLLLDSMRDVTKVNTVVGIGTTLHKFTDINGNPAYLPCVSYHLPETDVRLFSPQTYHQMHGGYSEVHSDCIRMLLKTSTIKIQIVREEHNLPVVFDFWVQICVLAYATPA